MAGTVTVDLKVYQRLMEVNNAYLALNEKLSSTVTNEVYNDDLDVNEHEFNVDQLKEIALDHYHG